MADRKVLMDACYNLYAYIDIRYIDNILYNYIFYYYYIITILLLSISTSALFIPDLDLLDLDIQDLAFLNLKSVPGRGGERSQIWCFY